MKEFLEKDENLDDQGEDNPAKLVILGIGNELRGDDILGSCLARKLSRVFSGHDKVIVFDGMSVPENYSGAIKRENPSHIILIDAADMGETPGHIRTIDKDEIARYHLSTHAMPLSFLMKYLERFTGAKIILIGIQPKETELSDKISKEVMESMERVVDVFIKLFSDNRDSTD